MKRLLLSAVVALLFCTAGTTPSAAQWQEPVVCTSSVETPCGQFEIPSGRCTGTACFTDRPVKVCAGTSTPGYPNPTALQRVLADAADYQAGLANSKIEAARSRLQPNQFIVRDSLFTCPAPASGGSDGDDGTSPPKEEPPAPEVVLPEPVEQIYRDIQIRAFDPFGLSTLSERFDIVVRDASVLGFTVGVPPFTRITENQEASGTIGVYGGEGAVTIGMTGAPSWMVLVEETFTNTSGRSFTELVIANPPLGSAGSYGGIRIVAQDSAGRRVESPSFTVEVVGEDGLRVTDTQGNVKTKIGNTVGGYVYALKGRKWISYDVLGGPPGFVVPNPIKNVEFDGSAVAYFDFVPKQAGTWPNVVYRAVDDQGRLAYSSPFKVVVEQSAGDQSGNDQCREGVAPTVMAARPPVLGYRQAYSWTWNVNQPVTASLEGELPPGVGLCTNGDLGLCGVPTSQGTWSGAVKLKNSCGGEKTISYYLENKPTGELRPCVGRFSPNNELTIVEDEFSFTISGTKGLGVSFCTPPYNQWDGGDWQVGESSYSSMYKSSATFDFIYPSASVPVSYAWWYNILTSIFYGDPPGEVRSCVGRIRDFCSDNIVFSAAAALGSTPNGELSPPIYLSGRDWRGSFWGSKAIYVRY